jgi:Fur family transcriptional regulator, ferric uptake regulator
LNAFSSSANLMSVKSPSAGAPPARELPEPARRAEALLRHASMRMTPARVRVLSALLDAERAFSHQEVQDALGDMDRVTLYRTLDFLTEAGLAHKISGDDRVFRYSAGAEHAASQASNGPHHQHGHFKCTRCSKVFCLDSSGEAALLRSALEETLGRGFQSHDVEFTIKGWCADCTN